MDAKILFNPIIKYVLIFVISYMYFNSINIEPKNLIPTLLFILIINVVIDTFMIENIYELIQYDHS